MTAACMLAGFAYVSDEALCIDPAQAQITPYPKSLALARSAGRLLGRPDLLEAGLDVGDETIVSPAQLGAEVATGELRLAHVVELVRAEGPPQLVPQPRQRGLAALLSLSFNHYKQPRTSFEVVSSLATGFASWRLEYADPRSAAALLRAELTA
jgi:hypothetical protein